MPDCCPFCNQAAEFRALGDAYEMDCRTCRVKVTIARTAAAMDCENPAATLQYIREAMASGVRRPVVTSVDMRR